MKRDWWFIGVGLLGLNGCAFPLPNVIHGVKPIYPESRLITRYFVGSYVVDNLTPTFRWEPAPDAEATYDFIIYERIGTGLLLLGPPSGSIGKEVYYRQGLTTPEHQVSEPLQASSRYYWSVRVRRGEQVSDWSRFDQRLCVAFPLPGAGACGTEEWPFFMFETPGN